MMAEELPRLRMETLEQTEIIEQVVPDDDYNHYVCCCSSDVTMCGRYDNQSQFNDTEEIEGRDCEECVRSLTIDPFCPRCGCICTLESPHQCLRCHLYCPFPSHQGK